MHKYTFHCQLKTRRMKAGLQRIKFNTEFSVFPRINELIKIECIYSYFVDEKKALELLPSRGYDDELSGLTCRVVQVMHFDKTYIKNANNFDGAVSKNAVGVLYLDELEDESICATGAA